MLLKEFRDSYLELILSFLWKEWSLLGIAGAISEQEDRIIDPEALLVFSIEMARHEPRLFDEILAWLIRNGNWIDTARLKNIIKDRPEKFLKVMGGALQYVSTHGNERKWRSLLKFCQQKINKNPKSQSMEALFLTKDIQPHPLEQENNMDPDFRKFFINRSKFKIQKESLRVPINFHTNIRFPLRMMFGVGAKSECILYLLTHDSGTPKAIADEVNLFWLSIQQVLVDLSTSKIVHIRKKGKRIEYFISQKQWWSFITSNEIDENNISPNSFHFSWLNWTKIFNAVAKLWYQLLLLNNSKNYNFLIKSKINEFLYELSEILNFKGSLNMELPQDLFQKNALEFLNRLTRHKHLYSLLSRSPGGHEFLNTIIKRISDKSLPPPWIDEIDLFLQVQTNEQSDILRTKFQHLKDRDQLFDKLTEVMIAIKHNKENPVFQEESKGGPDIYLKKSNEYIEVKRLNPSNLNKNILDYLSKSGDMITITDSENKNTSLYKKAQDLIKKAVEQLKDKKGKIFLVYSLDLISGDHRDLKVRREEFERTCMSYFESLKCANVTLAAIPQDTLFSP